MVSGRFERAGPAAPAFRQGNRLATNCLPNGCRERLRTSLSCRTVPFLLYSTNDAQKYIVVD